MGDERCGGDRLQTVETDKQENEEAEAEIYIQVEIADIHRHIYTP